jgi:signal transduction histidine kinase
MRRLRAIHGVLLLTGVGLALLVGGALAAMRAEKKRLAAESREVFERGLAQRARGAETAAAAALDELLAAGQRILSAPGDPMPDLATPLVLYSATGVRVAPIFRDPVTAATVLANCPDDARLVLGSVDREEDRPAALARLFSLESTDNLPIVRAQALFRRAAILAAGDRAAEAAAARRKFADGLFEHLATTQLFSVAIELLPALLAEKDGPQRSAALAALKRALIIGGVKDPLLLRGVFDRLAGISDAARSMIDLWRRDLEETRARFSPFPDRLPEDLSAAAPDRPIAWSPPGFAGRAVKFVDPSPGGYVLTAVSIDGLSPDIGAVIEASEEPVEANDHVSLALRGPLAGKLFVVRLPPTAEPFPWQTVMAVLLIAAAFLPLIIGWVISNRSIEAEKKLLAARSSFLATVAHQLKTPVANLRLFVETLVSGRAAEGEERRKMEEILLLESEKMSSYLERVLAHDRVDASNADAAEDIRAQELLETLVPRWRRIAQLREIDFETKLVAKDAVIRGQERDLADAFHNILDNAFRLTESRKRIAFTAEIVDNRLFVRVIDEGPGIPDDEKARIFERYFTGKIVRARGEGTGLGLSIAQSAISAAGGTIAIESTGPRGTTMLVSIPIIRKDATR